jgi:hypothetical protein
MSDEDTAIRLLEEALHLRVNGERAPGGNETRHDWERRAEAFLRSRPVLPQVEVIYLESWRAEIWAPEIPSRPGWQVRCAEHGLLGSPPEWAY